MTETFYDETVTDRCVHCEESLTQHSEEGQHCLFQPTTFKGMTMREFAQWLCSDDAPDGAYTPRVMGVGAP